MKKLMSYLLFVLFYCNCSVDAQQLYFNHLSVDNGLSQGVNNCIYRDSKGFVWISSFDGLNRFDGMSCINFRTSINEKRGLRGTLFLNILEDKNSNLWIGSNAGLNYYNRFLDQFQNFRVEGPKNKEQIYSPFYIDDKNYIWLQSGSDILIFNSEKKTFEQIDHFNLSGNIIVNPCNSKLYEPLQKIFVINNNLPVLWQGRISENKIQWKQDRLPIPADHVTAIVQADTNDYWIGTNNGIYEYRSNKLVTFISRFEDQQLKNISSLHLDQRGTLWAGTLQMGLFNINVQDGKVIRWYQNLMYNNYGLSGNQIQYIYTDEKGDLWVSVWGKGVDYTSLNKFRFNHYITREEAVELGSDNFIRSILQVNKEFWCGTQSGGILILDENKKIIQTIRGNLPISIEHICLDKNNQVWAATNKGLFLINVSTKKVRRLPDNDLIYGPAANQYNYINCMPNGNMLASTNSGIYIVEKVGGGYQIKSPKGLPNNKNVNLTSYIDQLNQVYLSCAFNGFSVYKLKGDSLLLLKDFPMEATIKCFYEPANSNLWIGTTLGLISYNKFTKKINQLVTTNEGLSNQYIYGIVADGNKLWLSTNNGINRFDLKSNRIKSFTVVDGLQSNEFNTYSFYKTDKGEIFFGGVNGLNTFYPEDIKKNSYTPQLILISLHLNDSRSNLSVNPSEIKSLKVDYSQNTIGFQFAVIHYANPSANTISYILDGYDKNWITVANKTEIRYANLPPGHYVLKVKAYNTDGIEADTDFSLPVEVMTPWWLSWWFILISALLIAGIIVIIFRSYMNNRLAKQKTELEKQQAVEKERNRISRDMHDDLGSGLTMIAILSEVVKKQLTEPEKAKETLEKIAVSSRDLVDNLQDIIWVINPKNDTLESLSSYIREYGLKYFEQLSVAVEFNYPEQFINTHLSEEQRRNIFLTVKETFNNIAKHAWCNKVTVNIQETATDISLTIHDDGKGFELDEVRLFANGLKNMQNRIEQVGGTYSINSQLNDGTLTEIKFHL